MPHIYHSALLLSPQTSAVHKLYEQHTRPLTRVVRGLPVSWELIVATLYNPKSCTGAAWSSCNKFIATLQSGCVIEVLDAVTLKRLGTFESPEQRGTVQWFSFSPDSRCLTRFHDGTLTAWDLQTGGPVGTITPLLPESEGSFSSAYSTDGKLVAAACYSDSWLHQRYILTYDLLSKTCTYSHDIPEEHILIKIWTHGELLRFATVTPGFVTTWEATFTLERKPTEVESLLIPDDAAGGKILHFLPGLSRLAFVVRCTMFVWDAKASKLLLESGPVPRSASTPRHAHFRSSFSSDGRFFAYMGVTQAYIWKESPTGYTLHQQLVFDNATVLMGPLLSPDGESTIAYSHPTMNLWWTKGHSSTPGAPVRDGSGFGFILEFSSDGTLAAFARAGGSLVTILDLQSGHPRLVIETSMRVEGLGVAGSTVVVVDGGRIVTWNLPLENCAPDARVNINDGVKATAFDNSPPSRHLRKSIGMSVSPDLGRIAVAGHPEDSSLAGLEIFDVSTGRCLVGTTTTDLLRRPWFTPDGRGVWGMGQYSPVNGWEIIEDSKSGATELKPLEPTACPPGAFSRKSLHDYKLTDDGWVFSPAGKRLLWLPHRWRSDEEYRTWSGRFLGLRYGTLKEVVILEFLE